jgi:hypothetical protein
MKKLSLSIFVALAFFVTAAVAQTSPSGAGQGSSPGMGRPESPSQQQPGMTQPDNSTPMGQTDQNNPNATKPDKGEKKLKGCIQSQGGQYVLETKKGKTVALTGQDVSAHVGHEVSVKGSWESSASAGAGVSSSSGSAAGSEKTFNVASVDMISDTCGGKSKGSSSKMGTSPGGSSNPSGTGTTAQPPQ